MVSGLITSRCVAQAGLKLGAVCLLIAQATMPDQYSFLILRRNTFSWFPTKIYRSGVLRKFYLNWRHGQTEVFVLTDAL